MSCNKVEIYRFILDLVPQSFVTPTNVCYMNFSTLFSDRLAVLIFVLGLIWVSGNLNAQAIEDEVMPQEESIDFLPISLDNALIELKPLNKPFFAFIYSRVGSSASTQMREEVFMHPNVITLFREKFINLEIELQSKEGMDLRTTYQLEKYKLSEYPCYLFFTKEGKLAKQEVGYKSPDELMKMANDELMKMANKVATEEGELEDVKFTPTNYFYNDYFEFQNQYRSGNREPEFLLKMVYLMRDYNEMYQGIVDEYLNKIGPANYLTPENSQFIFDFADDVQSKAYNILITNRPFFVSRFTQPALDDCIKRAIRTKIINTAIASPGNLTELNAIVAIIKVSGLQDASDFEFQMRLLFFEKSSSWQNYAQLITAKLKSGSVAPEVLEKAAWQFSTIDKSENYLQDALLWIEKAIDLKPNEFSYHETYAVVLYKLGKTSKAMSEAENAAAIARKQGVDYLNTLKLTELIRRGNPIPTNLRDK